MPSFQERLDVLVEDLELTVEEREFLHENRRKDRQARRVVNLMADYLDTRALRERQVLLKSLFEAVQDMRATLQARTVVVPAGHVLVREDLLENFREMAVEVLSLVDKKGRNRVYSLARLTECGQVVLNLDPEIRDLVGEADFEEEEGD